MIRKPGNLPAAGTGDCRSGLRGLGRTILTLTHIPISLWSGITFVSSFCCVFFPVPSWFFQKKNTESAKRHPWSSSSFVQPESGFSCTDPDMLHYISDSCKSLRFAQSFAGASCVGQVIAKVCASWELYEHSNGFFAHSTSFVHEEVLRLVQIV